MNLHKHKFFVKPRSKLEKHKIKIFRMKADGASLVEIQKWLLTQGMKCEQTTIARFIKKWRPLQK